MKQLVFMVLVTTLGIGGSVLSGPFIGVLVYYLYAVLRPQFAWEWSLRNFGLHTFPWSFYVAVSAMIITAATAVGLLRFPASGPAPGYPKPKFVAAHYLLWAFAIWVTLSVVFARHPDVAMRYYTELIKLFVMFTVAVFAVQRVRQLWWLLIVVTLADVYTAYEVNFHYFSTGYMYLAKNGFGGLDNNGAALMFAMIVPACYFLWEATTGRFRWVYLAGIAFLGHAVLLSFSRGAMLSLMVTSPLLLVYSQRKKYVFGFLAVAGLGVAITAGPEVQDRFFSISEHDADASAQSRFKTWSIAIQMASEEPLFGFGVRNSNLYALEYGADIDGRSVHSQYLQIAADCGFVGSGLFIALMAASLYSAWTARRAVRGRTDPDAMQVRAMSAAVSCGLAVYAVGASFLSLDTFEMPYVLMLIAAQLHGLRPGEATTATGDTVVTARVPAKPAGAARRSWPTPGTPMSARVGRVRPQPEPRYHRVHEGMGGRP